MDCEKIGALIRALRTERRMTQRALAAQVGVTDRAVSKWERGLGCPDVSLLADVAGALGVGVEELLSGALPSNRKDGGNMKRTRYYVCPQCGNLLLSTGAASVGCCGRPLEPLTAVKAEEPLPVEDIEDERLVTGGHPMEKDHYISFVAYATGDAVQIKRLYPEWGIQVRIPGHGHGTLLWYCTRHGLFYQNI